MKELDAAEGQGENEAEGFLRQAQRDWVAYRDNACAAKGYLMHGGSAEPMVIYGCRARLTQERTFGLYYLTEQADPDSSMMRKSGDRFSSTILRPLKTWIRMMIPANIILV